MKIEGRNSVIELLKTDNTIDKILVQETACNSGSGKVIFSLIKQRGIKYIFTKKEVMDYESGSGNHQGFIAYTSDFEYADFETVVKCALSRENPLIVVLDGIEDPHNLGSIIRVCECGGADGIIIPKHRSASVNETVVKVASGAAAHIMIARETNINAIIAALKEKGFWIYGGDSIGESMYDVDFRGKTVLVIGGEGNGIKKLTMENCDKIVSIPMYGKINSLNASVACGILVYEINRQRFCTK